MSALRSLQTSSLCIALVFLGSVSLFGGKLLANPLQTPDSAGVLSTYSTASGIDISNPFFQSLGSNGRTCNTCHISGSAWTITQPTWRRSLRPQTAPIQSSALMMVPIVQAQMSPRSALAVRHTANCSARL